MLPRPALPLLAAMALSACATPQFLCLSPSGLQRLTIVTEPGTNGGMATEIDLVFITDTKVLRAIEQLTARDYFAHREQMVRNFPSGFKIRSFGLEPTQGQVAYETQPPCHIVGTLLFVNYHNSNPNRIRTKNIRSGTLLLGADDFVWQAS